MTKLFTVTLAALALSVPAFAAPVKVPATPVKVPAKVADTFPQKCPVTGETVASLKDSVGTSVYKGKTYYFCCTACKPEFDKNPAKFAKADVPAKAAK